VGVGRARQDFFHVALSMPILLLFTGCITLYTLVILLWAGLYSALDHPNASCGIAPFGEYPKFYHAFIFSLETMTTIGYDSKEPFADPSNPEGPSRARAHADSTCVAAGKSDHARSTVPCMLPPARDARRDIHS